LLITQLTSLGCAHRFLHRYTVKEGDTLWSIASTLNADPEIILDDNRLKSPRDLKIGQLLHVRGKRKQRNDERGEYIEPLGPASKTTTPVAIKIPEPQFSKPKTRADKDPRSIKLAWPVKKGVAFRNFDLDPRGPYEGIAIGAPMGSVVQAAADGEVIYAGQNKHQGHLVILRHDEPFMTVYAHLQEIQVKPGQNVRTGDVVGLLGRSGDVDAPQLQFQVRKNRIAVDPMRYFKK